MLGGADTPSRPERLKAPDDSREPQFPERFVETEGAEVR